MKENLVLVGNRTTGVRTLEDLPLMWKDLSAAGLVSGHAHGKALRSVKTCRRLHREEAHYLERTARWVERFSLSYVKDTS